MPHPNIRTKATYVFGQDEWHVASNLTLTYGLRYEYSTPKSDTKGRTYSVIPGAPQSTVFPGAPLGLVFPGDQARPEEPTSRIKQTSLRVSALHGSRSTTGRPACVAVLECSTTS